MIIVAGLYSAAAVRPQGWWAYPLLLAAFALGVAVLPSLPTSPLGSGRGRPPMPASCYFNSWHSC